MSCCWDSELRGYKEERYRYSSEELEERQWEKGTERGVLLTQQMHDQVFSVSQTAKVFLWVLVQSLLQSSFHWITEHQNWRNGYKVDGKEGWGMENNIIFFPHMGPLWVFILDTCIPTEQSCSCVLRVNQVASLWVPANWFPSLLLPYRPPSLHPSLHFWVSFFSLHITFIPVQLVCFRISLFSLYSGYHGSKAFWLQTIQSVTDNFFKKVSKPWNKHEANCLISSLWFIFTFS